MEKFKAIYEDRKEDIQFELIIVNNGSSDNTREVLGLFRGYPFLKIVEVGKNIGYGGGVMRGLKSASGGILCWTHSDLQTDPQDVFRAFDIFVDEGGDCLVKGSRNKRPLIDRIFTLGMSFATLIFLWERMKDINGQPKLFPRRLYSLMRKPPHDFSFDLYLMHIAKSAGYKIVEFPVKFGVRIYGESKSGSTIGRKFKTSLKTFSYILKLFFSEKVSLLRVSVGLGRRKPKKQMLKQKPTARHHKTRVLKVKHSRLVR